MMDKPLFTIGIASYNYGKYIIKELEAIRDQTFQDFEIVISDDASTDDSVQVIRKFIEENPQLNIKLICKEKNAGLIANKNTIIENANGQYLLLCDADDWMHRQCLEKIANVITNENPDRVITNIVHIDEDGKIIQIENIPDNQTKWGWSVHHGSAYRMDIIKKHNIRILGEPDDVFFTLDFTKYCKKFSCINENLYYWLVHRDSEGRKKRKINDEYFESFFINEIEYIYTQILYLKNNSYSENDIEELRFCLLKWYYFDILFAFQSYSLKDKLKYYKKMKKKMKELDANYLENDYLKRGAADILRPYAAKAIRLCSRLEKMHMMSIALVGYHIVSRVKYFDQ